MKFALDTDAVIGLNAGHTRLRYATNTEATRSAIRSISRSSMTFFTTHFLNIRSTTGPMSGSPLMKLPATACTASDAKARRCLFWPTF